MVIRKEALTPAELQYVLTLGLECPNCRSMEKMEIHGHVQTGARRSPTHEKH